MTDEQLKATIAGDEDFERAWVLVDAAAPDAEAAWAALLGQAPNEWALRIVATEQPPATRRWYRPVPDDDEQMQPCGPDDEGATEWWSFELPDEEGLEWLY